MTKAKKIVCLAALLPLIVALVVCISINAAATVDGEELTLSIHGQEIRGAYIDTVSKSGYRHIEFVSYIPYDMDNYAVIIDVNAPVGENVNIIDDEETLEKFGGPGEEEFGYEIAEDEYCYYTRNEVIPAGEIYAEDWYHGWGGIRGGEFMYGKKSSDGVHYDYDDDNNIKRVTLWMEYFVGA